MLDTVRSASASLLVLVVSGCASAARDVADPLTIQLVDSIPWSHELGDGHLRRVQVRSGTSVDTIPGVLTSVVPQRVSPSRVLGFAFEADAITGAYEYDVARRRVRRLPLPEDLDPVFSAPSFSPDGRYLAYVVAPGDATGWAVVRSWPARREIWRSDRVQVPATDAPGGNLTRWVSPDTAEAFVETAVSTDNGWYHVLGSVRRRAVLSADTVRRRSPARSP